MFICAKHDLFNMFLIYFFSNMAIIRFRRVITPPENCHFLLLCQRMERRRIEVKKKRKKRKFVDSGP